MKECVDCGDKFCTKCDGCGCPDNMCTCDDAEEEEGAGLDPEDDEEA